MTPHPLLNCQTERSPSRLGPDRPTDKTSAGPHATALGRVVESSANAPLIGAHPVKFQRTPKGVEGRTNVSLRNLAYDRPMRVLVVEDDDSVAAALQQALATAGHTTDRVSTGTSLLLRHHQCDLVLLDLGLADGDAYGPLRKLRAISQTPVIVVSARGDERSAVRALRLGADDYLVKPVRLKELLARLDAVTRRRELMAPSADVVEASGLRIDLLSRTVHAAGEQLSFTTKEFDLLGALARRVGHAVSREQILDEVWGDAYATTSRSFDVHLTQIRAKLPAPDIITTIRGFGYRLEA